MSVDATNDIAEFLTSRRARVTPEQVGLPAYGTRRVKGLRREEVASLAGVSVEYYKHLERGNAGGVSDTVLGALARALHLLGACGQGPGRAPTLRDRAQSLRPWPLRPGRRALDPQRAVPHLLGRAQRPYHRTGSMRLTPSDRRRTQPRERGHGHGR